MSKWGFIENELLSASVNAALQTRNGTPVYCEGLDDDGRKEFKKVLKKLLGRLATQYTSSVCSEKHEQNIAKIADDLTQQFCNRNVLYNDRFRIGIAQKALNLYLKYLWCLERIPKPPHCPFDGLIIEKLSLANKKRQHIQWTALETIDEYRQLVNAGMKKLGESGHGSLSDWELEEWSARNHPAEAPCNEGDNK